MVISLAFLLSSSSLSLQYISDDDIYMGGLSLAHDCFSFYSPIRRRLLHILYRAAHTNRVRLNSILLIFSLAPKFPFPFIDVRETKWWEAAVRVFCFVHSGHVVAVNAPSASQNSRHSTHFSRVISSRPRL